MADRAKGNAPLVMGLVAGRQRSADLFPQSLGAPPDARCPAGCTQVECYAGKLLQRPWNTPPVAQFPPDHQAFLQQRQRFSMVAFDRGHSAEIVERDGDAPAITQFPRHRQAFLMEHTGG